MTEKEQKSQEQQAVLQDLAGKKKQRDMRLDRDAVIQLAFEKANSEVSRPP